MMKLTRRALLFGSGAVVGGWLTARYIPYLPVPDGVDVLAVDDNPAILNDASGLSPTPIHKHIILKQDPGTALVEAIRAEMTEARQNNRPVNVGAARHSMGGQAIPREGHAITLDNAQIEVDSAAKTMRLNAGTRWSQVIARLDPMGLGPRVMQSNNDFGVAATFCVNAHGWPVPEGPMGATVRAFDLILPDGELVTCSRSENAELFGMTMGGYGLTGAIVSMEVDVAQNLSLKPTFERMPAEEFGQRFLDLLQDKTVNLAYGRLNVDRANFFRRALLISYRATPEQSDLPPASGSGRMAHLASRVYRAQLANEPAKRLRWWMETRMAPAIGGGAVTRNSLINEPVVTLDDRNPDRTDILHEYFVAPERFADFIEVCRRVIPNSYQEFLNVTLRFIDTDTTSWLSYAPVPRIAAVMSFTQEMTTRGEADMAWMTQQLIDGILSIGGTYYLPYRPHARLDQLQHAYPRAQEFALEKRRLDPDLLFRNNLWDSYLGQL